MAHESRDQLIHWLNDALGMEETMIQTLGNHVKDAKDFPQIQQQLQQHLDLTRQQADLVRTCI